MYLKAKNSHLIRLPIGADSIELPIVVSNTQQFNATNDTVLPILVRETEPPIVVNRTPNVATNIEEVVCVIDYKQ